MSLPLLKIRFPQLAGRTSIPLIILAQLHSLEGPEMEILIKKFIEGVHLGKTYKDSTMGIRRELSKDVVLAQEKFQPDLRKSSEPGIVPMSVSR